MSVSEQPTTVKIAGVQTEPKLGDVAANLGAVERWIEAAARAGARFVVFTECALTGYMFDSLDEARRCAQIVPGPATERLVEACARWSIWAVVGLLERAGGSVYNACVLVGPSGCAATYRKVHLPHIGVDHFTTPGDSPFVVHDAGGIKVGLHICYDGSFPEPARVMALQGADLLVLPTNWAGGAEPLAEHMMACRSMENVVYSIAVNRVGTERGARFIGRSGIFDPLGHTLAFGSADREEMLVAEIDLHRARHKRIERAPGNAYFHRIDDRRPEFYQALTGRSAARTGTD